MRRAFSLVELSIVLVILGLLVGGVLSGQSLIHAAELRSVSEDMNKYQAALNSFRDKYFAIPGDMNNATQFWGRLSAAGTCVTNSGMAVNAATGVCDGDSDGLIDHPGSTAGQSYETMQAWRELANAGMIEGSYSGVAVGTYGLVRVTNAPPSKLNGASLVSVTQLSTTSLGYVAAYHYAIDYGNVIGITLADSPYTGASGGVLLPQDAWNIDTKMDDGKPGTGIVMSNWSSCTSSASNSDFSGSYSLTATTKACTLLRKNAI